jgi:hypothetical protein
MQKNVSENNLAPHLALIAVQLLFGSFPVVENSRCKHFRL